MQRVRTVSLHSNGNLQDNLGAASLTDSRRIKDPMSLMNLEVVLLTQFPGEIQVLRQQQKGVLLTLSVWGCIPGSETHNDQENQLSPDSHSEPSSPQTAITTTTRAT